MKIEKQPENNPNKGGIPRKYKDEEAYMNVKRVRDKSYPKEYQRKKRKSNVKIIG